MADKIDLPDRRAVTAAAFDQHEDEPAEVDTGTEAATETPAADDGAAAAEALKGDDGAAVEVSGEQGADAEQGGRDEKGRFKARKAAEDAAAKQEADAAGEPAPEAAPEVEKPAAPAADLKAPQSWKPAAREKWVTVDPEVKAEIARVDREVRKTMQEAAGTKRILGEVEKTIQPFASYISQRQAARGQPYNPLPVISSLLRTSTTLDVGTMEEKAQIVAQIINSRGISLDAINKLLGGEAPAADGAQPGQPAGQPYRDPRVDQLLADQERNKQQREQQVTEQGKREMEQFAADPKNAFFEDVRPEMSALMLAALDRGQEMTMAEAYTRAIRANPEIWSIVQQREQVAKVKAKTAANTRAKLAASSVRTAPVGDAPRPAATDRRSTIAQAWAENEGP